MGSDKDNTRIEPSSKRDCPKHLRTQIINVCSGVGYYTHVRIVSTYGK